MGWFSRNFGPNFDGPREPENIMAAIMAQDVEAILKRVQMGDELNIVYRNNAIDRIKEIATTPLIQAVALNDQNAARYLLDHSAEINLSNTHGMTPLNTAILQADIAVLNLLIERGAMLNAQDGNGLLPLIMAWERRKFDFVEALLNAGADPFKKDSDDENLFSYAKGNEEEILLKARNVVEYSPAAKTYSAEELHRFLFYAVEGNCPEFVTHWLSQGAKIDVADSFDRMPLWIALDAYNIEAAIALLKAGADPNVESNQGGAGVFVAIEEEEEQLVKAFLEAGVDVNDGGAVGESVADLYPNLSSELQTVIKPYL